MRYIYIFIYVFLFLIGYLLGKFGRKSFKIVKLIWFYEKSLIQEHQLFEKIARFEKIQKHINRYFTVIIVLMISALFYLVYSHECDFRNIECYYEVEDYPLIMVLYFLLSMFFIIFLFSRYFINNRKRTYNE